MTLAESEVAKSKPTSAARGRVASLACNNCRKRKSRCDGNYPACAGCVKSGLKDCCVYDLSSDGRRKAQAQLNRRLSKRLEKLEDLIQRIRRGGEEASHAIEEIQRDKPESTDDYLSAWEQSEFLTLDGQGQVHYYGGTSTVTTTSRAITINSLPSPAQHLSSTRTAPPEIPPALVNHLLDLYFCWQDTYYKIFEKDLFLRDRRLGGKYFSPFLFNAVLAHAAMLCDLPILRSDPSDPSTAGYMFFRRAQEDIHSELTSESLTAIQGLLLLASREAGNGRNSIGWVYSGMAFRMALDLGLHLDCTGLSEVGYLSPEETRARNTTFWGCYLFDQGWSLYLGRPSVLRIANVTVQKPQYNLEEEPMRWHPVYRDMTSNMTVDFYPHNTLTAILRLSEIVEEIVTNLYSPRSLPITAVASKIKSILLALESWKRDIPDELEKNSDHPSIIMLFALYNAAKLFLHRKISQRTHYFKEAIEEIVYLLAGYRSLYTLQMSTNLSVYVASTAATACLETLHTDSSKDAMLQECLVILHEIGQSWISAKSTREELHEIDQSWISAKSIREELESLLIFGTSS